MACLILCWPRYDVWLVLRPRLFCSCNAVTVTLPIFLSLRSVLHLNGFLGLSASFHVGRVGLRFSLHYIWYMAVWLWLNRNKMALKCNRSHSVFMYETCNCGYVYLVLVLCAYHTQTIHQRQQLITGSSTHRHHCEAGMWPCYYDSVLFDSLSVSSNELKFSWFCTASFSLLFSFSISSYEFDWMYTCKPDFAWIWYHAKSKEYANCFFSSLSTVIEVIK